MTYPRVNLIRKNERRHQGAVSRRFLFVSIVVTPIFLVAILSGVKLIQYGTIRMDLQVKNELWADLEPRLKLFKEEENGLNANQSMLDMLAAWEKSKQSPSLLMVEVQNQIPANIQLTRLSVQSDLTTSVYSSIASLKLPYHLSIQGVSHGDRAERAVLDLSKFLGTSDFIRNRFGSVNLESMKKRTNGEGEDIRTFNFESSVE